MDDKYDERYFPSITNEEIERLIEQDELEIITIDHKKDIKKSKKERLEKNINDFKKFRKE